MQEIGPLVRRKQSSDDDGESAAQRGRLGAAGQRPAAKERYGMIAKFGHGWTMGAKMSGGQGSDVVSTADRELVTSRVIDAPRERVFRAVSDPERLARWWGPKGFTNTFHEFDLRPGGWWRFVMHAPNGANFPNESVFVEVAPPERVVFRHVSSPQFEMTLTFEDEGDTTVVGWRQLFGTAAECRRIAKIAVEANEQNLDRLAAEVAEAS